MSTNKIIFFDIPSRSPQVCWSMNTWRTRLLLNYKGLDYKTEWASSHSSSMIILLTVSPNEQGTPFTCPAIQLPDGSYIMDSYKIVDVIEEKYPEPSVHLNNPMQDRLRASMIKFMTEMVPIYVPGVAKNIIGEKSIDFFLATRLQTSACLSTSTEKSTPLELLTERSRSRVRSRPCWRRILLGRFCWAM
ncbi:Uncharacterized protein HZ326_22835 [Fusarium oxysporum f. sp. albedinis]|nr:Uncharacterized protein HZ326_22835 [Fusarium oxysporum f. sp. albedinis]